MRNAILRNHPKCFAEEHDESSESSAVTIRPMGLRNAIYLTKLYITEAV